MLVALLAASLGCNLGAGNSTPPTATPTYPPPALPTITLVPTQPVIFITATAPATVYIPATRSAATLTNCAPYTQWPVYTVQSGDTLGAIAQRSGTTLAQLMTANCLSDSNLIFTGQTLYVPVLPVVGTPTPTRTITPAPAATPLPNVPVWSAQLTVTQVWPYTGGGSITYYKSVRISAGEVYNAATVNFYVNDPASGKPILIGTDSDPWDGAYVDYSFPAAGTYTFSATANNEAISANSSAVTVLYDPSYTPPGAQQYNTLTLAPTLGTDSGWIVLASGARVTVIWPDEPGGAVRVDFTLAPTGTGMTPQTIGSDLTPADGASFVWTVPGGMTAHLQAVATMPNGQTLSSEIANIIVQ